MRNRTQPFDIAGRTLPKIRDVLGMQVSWFSPAQAPARRPKKNLIVRANQRHRITRTDLRINEERLSLNVSARSSS